MLGLKWSELVSSWVCSEGEPLLDDLGDLVVLWPAAHQVLGEDELSVALDIEHVAVAEFQFDLDRKSGLKLGRQTVCLGLVASGSAVGDQNLHLHVLHNGAALGS